MGRFSVELARPFSLDTPTIMEAVQRVTVALVLGISMKSLQFLVSRNQGPPNSLRDRARSSDRISLRGCSPLVTWRQAVLDFGA